MLFRKCFFIILLVAGALAQAQENTIDSLRTVLLTSQNDIEKSKASNALGEIYFRGQIHLDSAFFYTNKALKLSKDYTMQEASALFNLGRVHVAYGDKDEALKYYYEALKVVDSLDDKIAISSSYNNIGGVLSELGRYEEANLNFEKALKVATAQNHRRFMATHHVNIGENLYHQKRFENSKIRLEKAFQIYDSLNQAPADAYLVYGNTLLMLGEIDSAKQFAELGREVAKRNGQLEPHSRAAKLLAEVAEQDESFEEALGYWKEHHLYADSVTSSRRLYDIEKVKINLELEDKEDMLLMHQSRKKYTYVIYAIGAIMLILLLVLVSRYSRIRKMKAEMRDIQLKLLKNKESTTD